MYTHLQVGQHIRFLMYACAHMGLNMQTGTHLHAARHTCVHMLGGVRDTRRVGFHVAPWGHEPGPGLEVKRHVSLAVRWEKPGDRVCSPPEPGAAAAAASV